MVNFIIISVVLSLVANILSIVCLVLLDSKIEASSESIMSITLMIMVPGINILFIIGSLVFLYILYLSSPKRIKNKLKEENKVIECPHCNVYTRNFYIKKENNKDKCPTCEKLVDAWKDVSLKKELNLKFSPLLTKKTLKEHEILSKQNKIKSKESDLYNTEKNQHEKYLEIRKEFLYSNNKED